MAVTKKLWQVTFSFPLTGLAMGFEHADAVESKFGRAERSGASMGPNGYRDLTYDATSKKAANHFEETVRAWCTKQGFKGTTL